MSDNKFSHLQKQWRSRRVYVDPKTGENLPPQLRADQLCPHPDNPKIHPQKQHDMVAGSIDDIGQVASVTININNGYLVDGHERAWLALGQADETLVDVEYMDITEDEHLRALIYIDRTREGALWDREPLNSLLQQLQSDDSAIAVIADDSRLQDMLSEMAQEHGLIDLINPRDEWVGMPEFEQDDISALYSIKVNFNSIEDLQAFAKLVGQTVTEKTTYIYYPKQEDVDQARFGYQVES